MYKQFEKTLTEQRAYLKAHVDSSLLRIHDTERAYDYAVQTTYNLNMFTVKARAKNINKFYILITYI